MKILVVAETYPSITKKSSGLFVHKLMLEFVKNGHEVNVLSPRSYFKHKEQPDHETINGINVYYPKFLSLPYARKNKLIFHFNLKLMKLSLKAYIKKLNFDPDVLYAHFVYPSGYIANFISNDFNKVPLVLSLGESQLLGGFLNEAYDETIVNTINSSDKVLCVSNKLRNEVLQNTSKTSEDVLHIPNGVDLNIFKNVSKLEARKKLGLPLDKKLVAFVGSVNARKGFDKLMNIMNEINDDSVKLIVATSSVILKNDKVIYAKQIPNNELNLFLSAADVFFFPTKAEGMSNALLEAMACKVPIVTSNCDFNMEFLDSSMAYLVDPDCEPSMYHALLQCLNSNQEQRINNAYNKVKELSLDIRYSRVFGVMEEIN